MPLIVTKLLLMVESGFPVIPPINSTHPCFFQRLETLALSVDVSEGSEVMLGLVLYCSYQHDYTQQSDNTLWCEPVLCKI